MPTRVQPEPLRFGVPRLSRGMPVDGGGNPGLPRGVNGRRAGRRGDAAAAGTEPAPQQRRIRHDRNNVNAGLLDARV
jgi:hypothetical protein